MEAKNYRVEFYTRSDGRDSKIIEATDRSEAIRIAKEKLDACDILQAYETKRLPTCDGRERWE